MDNETGSTIAAREAGKALIEKAGGPNPLWYAVRSYPRPDGRRVIGGWKTEEFARDVCKRLGYEVDRMDKYYAVPKKYAGIKERKLVEA